MNAGIYCALGGAALFGASTPVAKLLPGEIQPVLLAGLLYIGSGLGLGLWLGLRGLVAPGAGRGRVAPGGYKWLAGAVISGRVVGAVVLMLGVARRSASRAPLALALWGVVNVRSGWVA